MDMKIKSSGSCVNANVVSKNRNNDEVILNDKAVKANTKSDSIQISAKGICQAELEKEVKGISVEIDGINSDDKVEMIKEKIQNGTYFVSSENVADAIIGKLVF